MPNKQELIDWIKDEERKGFSSEQLYNTLIRQGYNSSVISQAIQEAGRPTPNIEAIKIQHHSKSLVLIIAGIVIGLTIIIALIFAFVPGSTNDIQTPPVDNTANNDNLQTQNDNQALIDNDQTFNDTYNEQEQAEIEVEEYASFTSGCGSKECFEEKFTACEPETLDMTFFEGLVYRYEIIGPNQGKCEIKNLYPEHPEEAWSNKEMTCLYDNTVDFDLAIETFSGCQGELFDLIVSLSQ